MKRIQLILLLLASYSVASIASDNPFEGAWQLDKGEYVDDQGRLQSYQDLKLTAIKVISGHHFSFITKTNGKFWAAGAGTISFDQHQYTETPTMTSFKTTPSGKYIFEYEIKDNQWSNSRFKEGKRVEFEVWQKMAGE